FPEPSPVLNLKAEYVGVTSVNLTWAVNDTASDSYTYRIEVVNGTSVSNETSNIAKAEMTGLIPGKGEMDPTQDASSSFFSHKPIDGKASGASAAVAGVLLPVLNLKAEYVDVTSVNLTWTVNDTASTSYAYRIEVINATSISNMTSNVTECEITGLIPGTSYTFKVFAIPISNTSEEEGLSLSLYTEPSPVLNLKAEYVDVTSVNLTWAVNDTASDSYTYRIEVVNGTSVSYETSNIAKAEMTGLIPGTLYNFTVFAVAADGQTEGEGASISLYT
ncbi:PTPRJ phosphatase, partial [Penelope pileata]|nr:PTPRJ phosphatase [Penelope pileata]